MATAHLIFGYIGAGKTTFARRLEHSIPAVRFSPDEWMSQLFGEDPPGSIFQAKAAAILELMEPLWTRCLSLGIDVVLDYGLWRRDERDCVRARAAGVGAQTILYALESSDDEAWERVDARNRAGRRGLYIARATFEALKQRLEPLGADEPFVRAPAVSA